MKAESKLFLGKILTIVFFCFVYSMNGFTQNKKYVEIDFIKEIKQGDTWENYDLLVEKLDKRFVEWKNFTKN